MQLDSLKGRTASAVLLTVLLTMLAIALRAFPVPFSSEWLYVLLPYLRYHSDALAADWTLQHLGPAHSFFDLLAGLPMLAANTTVVAWVGRVFGAAVVLRLLLRLGEVTGIPLAYSAVGIAIWLATGQGLDNVGNEWMVGTFEAKPFAYAALLGSLMLSTQDRRPLAAGVLLGLSFSLHPAVGLWGGIGILGGAIASRTNVRKLALIACGGFFASLPGLVPLLLAKGNGQGTSADTWEFFVRLGAPQHVDPSVFNRTSLFLIWPLLIFNLLSVRKSTSTRTATFLGGFQLALAVFFALGLVAFQMGQYAILQYMPFRLLPVMLPLFFFWNILDAYHRRMLAPDRPWYSVFALICLLGFVSPTTVIVHAVADARAVRAARSNGDDYARAFIWIRDSTPESGGAILPPWREDSYFLTQRPQLVNIQAVPYGDLTGWRLRIESVLGPLEARLPDSAYAARYRALAPAQVEKLAKEYHLRYLVTDALLPFSTLLKSGSVRVYDLGGI
jgi:hypothetical protein